MTTVPTEQADYLVGDAGNNTLLGLGGDDQLYGEGGNDTLDGGAGGDALSGGSSGDIQLSRRYPGGKGLIAKVRLRGFDRLDTVTANESSWRQTA